MDLEKKHKDEVEKLKRIESKLTDLISKTDNELLQNIFLSWLEQRSICNTVYIDLIGGLVNDQADSEWQDEHGF